MRTVPPASGTPCSGPSAVPLLALIVIAFTMACGSPGGKPPKLSGNSQTTVVLSSTANDQLSEFHIGLESVSLTSQAGKKVTLMSVPTGSQQDAEFIHVNAAAEPLITATVPQDVYTGATVTVGSSYFTCVALTPSGGLLTSTFLYGFDPSSAPSTTVTVNLPSPITITGDSVGLSLDLLVSKSASYPSCYVTGIAPFSITPTLNLIPITFSSPATNPGNGKVTQLEGQISATDASGSSFTLTLPQDSRTISISSNGSTVYQGINGFPQLTVGMFLDLDGALLPDGSLLATRIAVPDPSATNVLSGPLLFVDAFEPALVIYGRQQQGSDYEHHILGGQYFSFDNATFQISPETTNLEELPFVPTFTGLNMVAGQNIYVSSPTLSGTSNPYTELRTITLIPQTINGTVVAASNSGKFSVYAIALAFDDLFPTLAVQQAQTTLLNNPGQVEVYVGGNTQRVNTQLLAVGSTFRFSGLVFNDNGTLRMDCLQVNDGVTDSSSTAPVNRGQVEEMTSSPGRKHESLRQTINVLARK